MFIQFNVVIDEGVVNRIHEYMAADIKQAFDLAYMIDNYDHTIAWNMTGYTPESFGWATKSWNKYAEKFTEEHFS